MELVYPINDTTGCRSPEPIPLPFRRVLQRSSAHQHKPPLLALLEPLCRRAPATSTCLQVRPEQSVSHKFLASLLQVFHAPRRASAYRLAEISATVLAASLATPTVVSPATTLTSIGMRDEYTVLVARAAGPSGLRRRAQMPVPSCGIFYTDCPNLHGGISCVDTNTDIFSELT